MAAMSAGPGEGRRHRLASLPLHPLLFAAFPVLFLFAQNLGIVAVGELFPPLALVVGAATLALVALTAVFRDARPAAVVVSAIAVGTLAYGHGLRAAASVHLGGTAFLVLWGGMGLGAVAFAILRRRRLKAVTQALNFVAVALVLTQLVAIIPFEARALTTTRTTQAPGGPAANLHTTRDIYYIILDRYGSARSIALNYDITDNGFYDWLASRGFAIARDSHANYGRTSLSLAATLNMTFLDNLAAQQGLDSPDLGPVDAMLQDHVVGRFLKQAGYRYIHIGSFWGPTQASSIADVNTHLGGPSDFGAALYDQTVLPSIARRLGLQPATSARQRQADNARYQFRVLESLRATPGPKFVFAHVMLPHPPYAFAADGRILSEQDVRQLSTKEQYRGQLLFTNSEMESFLEPLLALPEAQRPIIIIQADEGPYPPRYSANTVRFDWTKATPDELEVKYGILNAMLLPGIDSSVVYPTISPVNTFRLLFDRYFGANLPLLPDRSYTSAGKLRPYDFTDITARLPALP